MTESISQRMAALMHQQLEQVQSYVDYLDQIKRSISSNDTQQLQKLVQQPPFNGQEIEQKQQQQIQLLAEAGYAAQALDDFIEQQDESHELATLRLSLKQQLGKLDQSLLINNLLLQKSQQRVRQSIQLLSGHDISSVPASYSRSGNAEQSGASKRILAQA